MARAAERFSAKWYRNAPGGLTLVFSGAPGVGKSFILKGMMNFFVKAAFSAWENGNWNQGVPSAHLIYWPDACDSVQKKEDDFMQDIFNASVLCLDDIGAEVDPWGQGTNKLCNLLTKRERMFNVVTTNIAPEDWEEKFDHRIADRLLRNSVIVDLKGVPSFQTLI